MENFEFRGSQRNVGYLNEPGRSNAESSVSPPHTLSHLNAAGTSWVCVNKPGNLRGRGCCPSCRPAPPPKRKMRGN